MPVWISRKTPNTKHQILVSHDIFDVFTNELICFSDTATAYKHIVLISKTKLSAIRNVFGKTYYEVDLE